MRTPATMSTRITRRSRTRSIVASSPSGSINQYYWYRLRAEIGASNMHSQITYFAPRDPGYVIDVSGAGVLKSSKHQADAQRFFAFLVSAQGQEIIAHSISFEYPIASGVTTSQPETPFDRIAAESDQHRRPGRRDQLRSPYCSRSGFCDALLPIPARAL